MSDNKYDSIVVGGGMAGLTSAAYLARDGRSVLLIEKNSVTGGLVNSFTRDGFSFDAGVRALLDAGIIMPMFGQLGIKLETVKSPVSLGVGDDIINIEDYSDLEEYRKLLNRLYPQSSGEIDKVLKAVRKIMKHMDVLYGIENPVFKDIPADRKFLFKKLLPWLPRFAFTVGKINRMNMPVEDYLDDIVSNPSLKDIISQHFFKNTPTFFAMSYFSLYLDYFYPAGGVGKLAGAVEKKVLEYGGVILNNTVAEGIDAESRFVTDSQGVKYYYNNLIWAADLKTFYNIVDIKGLSNEISGKFNDSKKLMLENRGGDSVFTVFAEVDTDPDRFREIAHGHFFYTPLKDGLGETHRKELAELLDNFDKLERSDILAWLDKFTRLNTYEISVPGLKDPAMAPPGKTGLIISMLAEYELFKKVSDAGWYEEFKKEFEDRIIRVISESVYPMLKDKLIKKFSFSPLSIRDRVGSSEGAIVGWSFEKPVPVVNKIQISDRSVYTPIPGIYQAGQWVYSPAGVPMSILTGRLAADKIIKKKKK
ncbi:MAG: NAD(P)/FAD-dependent oxidoreductase [Marinilabiliaceae bacterium]|jgi:phytoene dehydrogenase-like protein|nr:NAD(P)/FAD-dependent oxidoreductase [Marinilabiliaceae bacterium]